jgi:hypothetical protein
VAVIVVAGLLTAVGVLASGATRTGHPDRPSGPAAAATPSGALGVPVMVVVVEPSGRLVGHDLLTGAVQVLATDAAGWPEGPVTVADQVLYISGGKLYSPPGRTPLAAADTLLPVGGRMAEVWATPSTGYGGQTASLFEVLPAWGLVTQVRVGTGQVPVAASVTRLVTLDGGEITITDANTGIVTGHTGPVDHAYDVVGASSDSLAFARTGGCTTECPLAIVDLTTGATTATSGFIGGGAVAGSGLIVAFAAVGPPPTRTARLVVVDGTSELPVATAIAVEEPVGAAVFDPTERWVVFGGPTATYLLDTAEMRVTRLAFVAGYSFTVLAA